MEVGRTLKAEKRVRLPTREEWERGRACEDISPIDSVYLA